MMKKLMNKLLQNSLLKALTVVVGGAAIAQIINFIMQPLLTRLYSPEEFGIYGIFSSGVSILITLITLSYEQSIIVAEEEDEAQKLLFGTLYIISIMTIAVLSVIIVFRTQIVDFLDINEYAWLYLLPISVGVYGVYNVSVYYNYRLEKHKNIAGATIRRTLALSVFQCVLCFFKLGYMGLVIGYVLSLFCGGTYLIKNIIGTHIRLENARPKEVMHTLWKYKNFPVFQMPTSFVNHFTSEIISFAMQILYTMAQVGFYSLVNRVLSMPISMISDSLRQLVIRQLSVDEMNIKQKRKYMYKLSGVMLLIWIIPLTILFLWGEELFVIFFGKSWEGIGEFVRAMSILYCTHFVAYPLTGIAIVNKKQHKLLVFQIIQMIVVIGSAVTASIYDLKIFHYLCLQSTLLSIVYICQSVVCLAIFKPIEMKCEEKT